MTTFHFLSFIYIHIYQVTSCFLCLNFKDKILKIDPIINDNQSQLDIDETQNPNPNLTLFLSLATAGLFFGVDYPLLFRPIIWSSLAAAIN